MTREKNWMTQRLIVAPLILLTLLIVCVGCGSTSVYVIKDTELVRLKQGETFTAKEDGWYLSDRAVDRIMNAKISKEKLR